MRRLFGKLMVELAKRDNKVLLLTGDIGYKIFDEFREKYPKRFINIGLCEQSMISAASGMALEGLKPYVYTITPFLIERPFEQVKLDIGQQNVNVKLVGYADYPNQGPTHAELDAEILMRLPERIISFFPKNTEEVSTNFWELSMHQGPCFMSLKEDRSYKKFNEISAKLNEQLPEIIKKIAKDVGVKEYVDNPDFFDERMKKWHQYGLLTHTRKVMEVFLEELDEILRQWNMYTQVEKRLSERIGWINKKTLFEISILFHDLGKVVCLHDTAKNRQHEAASAKLLDNHFLQGKLMATGLEEEHLNYIRRCVEMHDAVGKRVRDILKDRGKLTPSYLREDMTKELCVNLIREHSDVKLEMGIFFICDSLGKFGRSIQAETLVDYGLSKDLKFGIMQQPINFILGQIYLQESLR